jgi:predicted transcriptional regulator
MEFSPKTNSRGMVKTTLRLTKEAREKLKELAPVEGRSRNNLITKMLCEGLARRKSRREGNEHEC